MSEANEREFIIKPDGSKDFGQITKVIEQATGGIVKAAPIRFQVGKGNESKGFMPIDLEFERGKDNFYTIITVMPHNKKIRGTLLYDESATSSTDTTNGELLPDNNNRGGVASGSAAKSNVPVTSSIPQSQENIQNKAHVVLKDVYGLYESDIEETINSDNNEFGIVKYKGHLVEGKPVYDITFESAGERDRFMEKYFGVSEEIEYSFEEADNFEEEISNNKIPAEEEPQSIFGDAQQAEDEFFASLGVERIQPKKAFNVVDDSDEALEAALKELNGELSKLSANPVLNPELWRKATKVGLIYLQRGANDFATWSKNVLNTTDEKIKPWLGAIWQVIDKYPKDVPFDEVKMTGAFKYVGSQYEKGIKSEEQIIHNFETAIGKDKAKPFIPLIKSAYAGVKEYFNPSSEMVKLEENGGNNNELNDGTNTVVARAGQENNKNEVGTNDESGKSSSGRGQSVSLSETETRASGSSEVHGHSSDNSRTASNSRVRTDKSPDTSSSTGNIELSGGIRDSLERQSILDSGRTGRNIKLAKNGRNNEGNILKSHKINKKAQAGNLDSIRNDLPMLLPEQQADVVFAEKRLLVNNKKGVFFTNGTGTGKTFTGLGVVKRFFDSGKKNILIVTPSDKINSDWQKSAKDYFDIDISPLENTRDNGEGVVVTTYANFGQNDELAKRDWNLIITDESQELMKSEQGVVTNALRKLRALTYHHNGLYDRVKFIENKLYAKADELSKKLKNAQDNQQAYKDIEEELEAVQVKINNKRREYTEEWKNIAEADKPKTVMLSATPFSYVSNIEYAEGYLFDYDNIPKTTYGHPDGKESFYIDNFGYRLRYNNLTKPDAEVDNSLMEINFHEKLRKEGALSGLNIKPCKCQ